MHVEWVTELERFTRLAPEWDRLAERAGSPFSRHDWFAAWWTAFGEGRRLAVCTLRDGQELAAVFPLCRVRGRLEPLSNAHSPSFAPLARDASALEELVAVVLAATPRLTLRRVPGESSFVEAVQAESARRGRLVLVQAGPASPFVDTGGEFDRYWRDLRGHVRRDFGRCRRLLDSLEGVRYDVLEEPGDLETALEQGFLVEGSGWKARRGTAILDSPVTAGFYRDVAARFSRLGKLRLSSLFARGELIAFNLNLLDHGRVWGLKGGYAPAYSRFAPGLLLALAEVERAFELGLASIELLGEEAPWKRKLTRRAHTHATVGSFARRPMPVVSYARHRYVEPSARRAYRRLLPGRARG